MKDANGQVKVPSVAECYSPWVEGVINPELSETARALFAHLPAAPAATPATDDVTKAYIRAVVAMHVQTYLAQPYVWCPGGRRRRGVPCLAVDVARPPYAESVRMRSNAKMHGALAEVARRIKDRFDGGLAYASEGKNTGVGCRDVQGGANVPVEAEAGQRIGWVLAAVRSIRPSAHWSHRRVAVLIPARVIARPIPTPERHPGMSRHAATLRRQRGQVRTDRSVHQRWQREGQRRRRRRRDAASSRQRQPCRAPGLPASAHPDRRLGQ